MSSITTGGKTTTYAYDADGIRTTKVVGGVTHEYLTLNGKVVYEKIGTGATAKIMVFTYDAQGRPFAVKYSKNNGESFTNYFYALNLQGDVVKIFRPNAVKDANETIIGYTERTYATYSYNAWGELTGITDSNGNSILNKQTTSTSLANLNPLRYRGYYYDNETGFYYLQSRYYDPANHRFLNADAFTSTDSTDAVACNMFAYCINSPIGQEDIDGTRPHSLMEEEVNSPDNSLVGGWKFRIDKENPSTHTQRHIHVYKNGDRYSQNEDGSPHDRGNNQQGPLPRKVQEALKRKTGWDFNGNRDRYIQKTIEEDQSANSSAISEPIPFFLPIIEPVPFIPVSIPFSLLPFPLFV